MPEKVAIVTLGCEKNQVDSDIMSELVEKRGYVLTEHVQEANVVVVNTCGFIDTAKEASVDTILRMARLKKHGQLKSLIVTGCLVQRYQEVLLHEMPEIDGLVGTGDFVRIPEVIEAALNKERPVFVGPPVYRYDDLVRPRRKSPVAFVKIAEGCDNGCTFCAIPLMRGRLRSRPISTIVQEVQQLVASGVKEICLIAQDLSSYGKDLDGTLKLPQLLKALETIDGLAWVRLHYLYPGALTDTLLEVMATSKKVVPYLDLPLQHSHPWILKRMRRPHHRVDVRELIAKVRRVLPDVAIRTSLIVGFPGETDAHVEHLLDFLSAVELDRVGVFTYSDEEGTPAVRLPDPIPQAVKEERAERVREHQRPITARRNARLVGRVVPVIIERWDPKLGVHMGRTPYDAPEVDGEVAVSGYIGKLGEIVPVTITHAYDYDFVGQYTPGALLSMLKEAR